MLVQVSNTRTQMPTPNRTKQMNTTGNGNLMQNRRKIIILRHFSQGLPNLYNKASLLQNI